jgi:hypothetical protein
MAEKKANKEKVYNKKYNKKREPLLRLEISTADTAEAAEEMRQMKKDIIKKSEEAKKGLVEMYRFAKEKGYFDDPESTE